MAYTLRGRLESRLTAALLPLALAAALTGPLEDWWPLEVAGLMLGTGLALDLLYDRLLAYQPGWAAAPLGLLELAFTMALVRAFGVAAPLWPAVGLFAFAWLVAQVLGQAGYPLLRLSYADEGGELGRAGALAALVVAGGLAMAGGVAWAMLPPTVHLAAGVHRGPLVIRRAENLVGARGAVVTGGIVVRSSHVHISGVTVVGGQYGIDVEGVHDVVLRQVVVRGAEVDGIHARGSGIAVRDCRVDSGGSPWAQGIDISYGFELPSTVEGCIVTGGLEGIVTHSAMVTVRGNRVATTSLRAITMTEMSMGMVEGNRVDGARGVGIFCGDHSTCEIEGNVVSDTRPDRAGGDRARLGFGILADYGARAELHGNRLVHAPAGVGSFARATIVYRRR